MPSQSRLQQAPATAGNQRQAGERRRNADRRRSMVVWPGTERRQAGNRRSWVGRRQTAEWRRL